MNDTHFAINIFILLLLIASGVAMAVKWVCVPYTLLLVIVGLIIRPMHFLPAVHVSPELILLIFLPALLFKLLKFAQAEPERKEYEILQGKLLIDTATLAELKNLQSRGAITDQVLNALQMGLSASHQEVSKCLAKLKSAGRVPKKEQIHRIQQHLPYVKKNRIVELFREGILSDSAHRELSEQFDRDRADELNEKKVQETASASEKST
jgi:hypothetical protein